MSSIFSKHRTKQELEILTVLMGSSGRPVAQSMTVWMPTNVAGMVSGLLRSACTETTNIQECIIPMYSNVMSLDISRDEWEIYFE